MTQEIQTDIYSTKHTNACFVKAVITLSMYSGLYVQFIYTHNLQWTSKYVHVCTVYTNKMNSATQCYH